MKVDPLTVRCQTCKAGVRAMCVRLGGPYGQGVPLRRCHPARYARARGNAVRQTRRWMEENRRGVS